MKKFFRSKGFPGIAEKLSNAIVDHVVPDNHWFVKIVTVDSLNYLSLIKRIWMDINTKTAVRYCFSNLMRF